MTALPHQNLTRRFVQLAGRNSWLPSLLARLTRLMVLGSLLLAIAPQRCASRVGTDLAHPAACGRGFARGYSVRGGGAATPAKCRRCFAPEWPAPSRWSAPT